MQTREIVYEVADRVATITLNRPDKLNAWTRVMEGEVRRAMAAAAGDDGVRAIVLTGAGRGFCAGADMSLLTGIGEGRERAREESAPIPGALDLGGEFAARYAYFPLIPKPVIAAVNGPAAGLGLVLALYADVRLASDEALFTTAFARRGLIAEHGIDWMLPRLVGLGRALDLLLSARKVGADEALAMGLVSAVCPAESFMDEVRAYARELAHAVSPRSMRVIKRQLYRTLGRSFAEAVRTGNEEMAASFESDDFKEGVAHFVEGRAAAFSGR